MRRSSLFAIPLFALLAVVAIARFPVTAAPTAGALIRASLSSVYYYAADGKRYVFPNEKTYATWYADFSSVQRISDAELAAIPLGGNVTYRPGKRMVKVTTDPKVYAIDAGGTLRPIKDEATAIALYGSAWGTLVDDLPDAFFANYDVGTEISSAAQFSPSGATATAATIAADRGIAGTSGINIRAIPMGDGKYSTSAKKGYVWSCQTSFTGGGAFATGNWISGSTWDLTLKPTVDGSVSWPNAAFTMTVAGSTRSFTSNALPKTHTTGTYPIATSDDAYQYDRNPNGISAQSLTFSVPVQPSVAASASCVGGEVGIAVTGVPIFNGFDAGGRDAVAHEIQDSCDGHPQSSGMYHYHGPSDCVATGDSELFGYAFDGFGIFSNIENGKSLTNDDLDECHGHAHAIVWEEASVSLYHYHLTKEFPYTVGCFRGTKAVTGPLGGGGGTGGMGGMPPPPRY
jgi:hypothetical protein